ncbi:putative c6 transcription factor protein [Rosellinia necatrix]|uniref:Putative c6 transcription factor protein n=1 Tax=Rosellinia necatrix TaxID=77044 RepID=A0A1W2TT40_ROSNE|nr:putative c6 transcription factor protein [Rosellinia necatrix]
MAGPGGGPPRRSHTKSRKGCENCKRRHIRCDENFPQCRNCTKHKVRCPYNDVSVPDERATTPDKPDLMWTPEIEANIAEWQRSGIFPFPNLVYSAPVPQYFTVEELRLIYHVAAICHELNAMDANNFTLWTRQIPTILAIAANQRYVMHALLAFSAEHIAFLTSCPLVGNMAYEHRGIALKGLQEAIGVFSPENSDAVLAASLVLSWQATDWRSWTQLMQGTSSVIDAMEPWKHESQFGEFIAESSTFPTAPPSPQPDRKPNQPQKEDLEAFQRTINQLAKVEAYLKQNKEDPQLIQQLASFLKGARKVSPIQSIEDQFDRLRPLRTWLFWLPVGCLKENGASPSALLVIAHYYTAAMMMERLFPEIGAAYFGSLAIGPVEEIARRLLSINVSGSLDGDVQTPLSLMEFPIDTISEFRSRLGWIQPIRTPSFPQFDPPNFYMSEHGTPPSTSSYMPYGDSPAFSWSTEDLSMLAPEPECGNAASPLALSSPYHAGQYLNIPSPSYGGYSPASSTFGEGSIVYSDHDEFGSFETSMAEYPHMGAPGHGNFSVGTAMRKTLKSETI